MSCTSSQMNILMGQGLGPRNTNREVQSSLDRVKLAQTRKIELGRSGEVLPRSRNPAQVA